MNNPLVIETSMNHRYTVKIKAIKCIQTEDVFYNDDIYFELWWANGNKGRYPHQGNKDMGKGDTWNLDLDLIFSRGVVVKLYEYDSDSRDDAFDSVTISEDYNEGGGPYFELPISEAQDWGATVKQDQDLQRGRYQYFFRVLPPETHFLSSLREASFSLEHLRTIASLPLIEEITESFTKVLFRNIFTTIVTEFHKRIADDSLSISDAARIYGCLNACRLQIEFLNSPNPSQGVQLAENYSLNLICAGIESEIERVSQLLEWEIDDDIT